MSRPILLMASLALIFAGPGCEEEKAAPAADTGFTLDLAPGTPPQRICYHFQRGSEC